MTISVIINSLKRYWSIQASGIKMIVTDDLDDAAEKAVNVADIVNKAEAANLTVQFGN